MLSRHPILSLGTFSRPIGAMLGLYKVRAPKKHPRYPMCKPAHKAQHTERLITYDCLRYPPQPHMI